ncbi:MAG: CPBP family intramembrane metalloprotease [Ktedonobacteraceae bacterium]|nr:CPBP family intramembrane metalloprotease [Ktedonobacteraceae bacterium]
MHEQIESARVRPFSLVLYLLIVFGLSWPFQFASILWGRTNLPAVFVLNSTAMIMVTVGTYIAGRFVFRDGFAGAGWSWGRPRYYLAVIGLAALLWLVPTGIDLAAGTLKLPKDFTLLSLIWLFALPVVVLIPGFGEEFGWRGYMLPRLAQRMSTRRAVLLHSLIWWAWHLPLVAGGAVTVGIAEARVAHLPVALSIATTVAAVTLLSIIPAVCHGVVFAYIWTRTQSLAVSTVYHAAYDGIRDSLSMIAGLGPIAGIWANALLIILGIVLLWRGDWRNLTTSIERTEPAQAVSALPAEQAAGTPQA